MKAKFFTLAIISMMATTILSTTSCDDDEDEPIVTPVTTDTVEIIQRTIRFEGITLDNIVVNDGTELKTLKDKLPATTDEYKVLSVTINNEELTDEVIEKTIITSDITIAVKALQYTKAPTLEQLQESNYTDRSGGYYFDFKNMKYYELSWAAENTYSFTTDLKYDETTGILSYEDAFADYEIPLMYIENRIARYNPNAIFKAENENFYGKYSGKNSYNEDATLTLKKDGTYIYEESGDVPTSTNGTYTFENNTINVIIDDFTTNTYYLFPKGLQPERKWFVKTEDSAPANAE